MVLVKEFDGLPEHLRVAHVKLMGEHRTLVQEFKKLTKDRFNIAQHEKFLDKLATHRRELQQHAAEVHRHGDWLHKQREVAHASHDGHPGHAGSAGGRNWRGWTH